MIRVEREGEEIGRAAESATLENGWMNEWQRTAILSSCVPYFHTYRLPDAVASVKTLLVRLNCF